LIVKERNSKKKPKSYGNNDYIGKLSDKLDDVSKRLDSLAVKEIKPDTHKNMMTQVNKKLDLLVETLHLNKCPVRKDVDLNEESIENLKTSINTLDKKYNDLEGQIKEQYEDIKKIKYFLENELTHHFEKQFEKIMLDKDNKVLSRLTEKLSEKLSKLPKESFKANDNKASINETKPEPKNTYYLQKKEDLKKIISQRRGPLDLKPVQLSNKTNNALRQFSSLNKDFDILYPDSELKDDVNDSINRILISIYNLKVECGGIEEKLFIQEYFHIDEDNINDNQTINQKFEAAIKHLNKRIRTVKTRMVETEEDTIQALGDIALMLFDFFDRNQQTIYEWHKKYFNNLPEALSNEDLEDVIQVIYRKCGIEKIPARQIDIFNSDLHMEIEQTHDPKLGNKKITREIRPGYRNIWSKEVLQKSSVAVNYRF